MFRSVIVDFTFARPQSYQLFRSFTVFGGVLLTYQVGPHQSIEVYLYPSSNQMIKFIFNKKCYLKE